VKHFLKYLIAFVAIAIVSCDSADENPPLDTGKDYFPLRTGLFQIYDVTEIQYTLGVPETLRYELKAIVTDSFPNVEGSYTYVINRSKRSEGDTEFSALDTWSARMDTREVVMNEENIPYLKIKLPVNKNDEWNGNLYNNKGEDTYLLDDVKTSITVNDETYADCIVINQNDNQDFVVTLDQRKEIYAKNIGLVSREIKIVNYCSVGECLGQQQIESGMIYTQTIKSHGVE
jgi:hypothetical protein